MNFTHTLTFTLAAALPLAACTPTEDTHALSVENCGRTVTFSTTPENVTMLGTAAVPTLHALGVLDRVKVKAGVFEPAYYSDNLIGQLDNIPTLTDRLDASGHLQISREAVISTNPDLVLGTSDTISSDALQSSGIAQIEEPAFCGAITGDVTFDHIYEQIDLYGTIFDRSAQAAELSSDLRDRIDELSQRAAQLDTRSVAVLYPSTGGTATYAYGRGSMSAPLMEAAGLTNVFADQDDRVFEVSAEEIIARNPDIIIALHTDGEAGNVTQAVTDLPGSTAITAVQDQAILPLLLNFAEPPTPLSVDGLEQIITFLEANR